MIFFSRVIGEKLHHIFWFPFMYKLGKSHCFSAFKQHPLKKDIVLCTILNGDRLSMVFGHLVGIPG